MSTTRDHKKNALGERTETRIEANPSKWTGAPPEVVYQLYQCDSLKLENEILFL